MNEHSFADRRDAGRRLAAALSARCGDEPAIVLALPRGGVPVASEVATALDLPLDVFIVRKLGVPGHEEYAMGAIASGGARVVDEEVVRMAGVAEETIDAVAAREARELDRRERLYREGRPPPPIAGRCVIVVDDGLATGSTMKVAVRAIRSYAPARIVVAVPVAAAETCEALRAEVDEVVCLRTPEPFRAVGLWYDDFSQTTDEEVRALLSRGRAPDPPPRG